jgi:peptidoglycan/xylan/chitin deacetylase (PgdA/CDA1 family)
MRAAPFHREPYFSEGDPSAIQVLRYRLPAPGDAAGRGANIPGDAMERQFELLDRWGCTLITFEDYRLFREGELHLPRRPVIVTFDGGIHAIHRHILPSLRLNGLRVVVFAPAGFEPVRRTSGQGTSESDTTFDPDHLVALQNSGCEIGSLTCSNNPLTSMPPEAVRHELYRSREILESVIGARVISLAYPGGVTSPEGKRVAQDAGYMFAVGTQTPFAVFGTDLFEIRRRTIDAGTGTLGLALSVFAPGARLGTLGRRSVARLSRPQETPTVRTAL